MPRQLVVPNQNDWAGYENDIEGRWAYRLLFGKTIEEVRYEFRDTDSIERAMELLDAPRAVFQYYLFAFVSILQSPEESVGESDCASVFLHFLCNREKRDPGSVAQIYAELRETIEHVASNQAFFDAPVEIYGDFREHADEIKALCEALHGDRRP